ncbi:hypothetical protein VTK56DRAFT_10270 [Thermocarpiscus australiensis]
MARLIPGVAAASQTARRADLVTDLTLLLSRLQRTILHADAEREARLRASEYERAKAQANINYARSLLTKLEQEALAVKIVARRQDVQADLVRKREVLDQLSERLSDLAEIAAAGSNGDGGDGGDTSDGEDILAEIIATPSESMDSTRSPDMPAEEADEPSHQTPNPLEPPPPPPAPAQTGQEVVTKDAVSEPKQPSPSSSAPQHPTTAAATTTTTTSQTLRSRHHDSTPTPTPTQPPPAQATTTSSSTLFGDHHHRPHSSPATTTTAAATTAISTTEAILDHHRAEQDALSASILQLAAELKASSRAFSASLEEDKEVVSRAGAGMARAGEGMEAVTRRMGALRKMTEGEGWWGRMRLYAMVYGLMVVVVVVVVGLPKLRF